jgi:hypothetical protein
MYEREKEREGREREREREREEEVLIGSTAGNRVGIHLHHKRGTIGGTRPKQGAIIWGDRG